MIRTVAADARDALVARVDEFSKRHEMAISTISRLALHGDSTFIARLRSGANVTLSKMSALEKWLVQYEHRKGQADARRKRRDGKGPRTKATLQSSERSEKGCLPAR